MVLLQEMGYEVIPVFIDEGILPKGLKIRKELANRFKKEFNSSTHLLLIRCTNRISGHHTG
jgi:hypothetical protein